MRRLFLIILLSLLSLLTADIINIPTDQPTIQAGIDIAVEGDTVLVAPGTYYENIGIYQKNDIHVIGSGAEVTTIDGAENGHVVVFNVASGSICNFSIINSGNDPGYSCGVFTSQARVIIENNIIDNNCRGISISSSSDGYINNNIITNCSGFMALCNSASYGLISNNLITDFNYTGIYHYYSSSDIFNNTIVGNDGNIALLLNPLEHQIVRNNIIVNSSYGIMVEGGYQSAVHLVDIAYNDFWNNSAANYWEEYGILPNFYSQPFSPQPGTSEINVDPLFVDPFYGDYHLQSGSPCIDSGDPNLPIDPDGTVSDIGAFYYHQNVDSYNYEIINSEVTLMNYPNPFNPLTRIEFSIQNDSRIEIFIFNIKGQKIRTLTNNEFTKGNHSAIWNGDDKNNNPVSSGIYYYILNVNGKTAAVNKCLLLK